MNNITYAWKFTVKAPATGTTHMCTIHSPTLTEALEELIPAWRTWIDNDHSVVEVLSVVRTAPKVDFLMAPC